MSVGSISSYDYDFMTAMFKSLRSGQSRIQKSELEEVQSAVSASENQAASVASPIDEIIDRLSEIDTGGDGISADELQTAVKNGTDSAPEVRSSNMVVDDGSSPITSDGTNRKSKELYTQSNQLGYDLFEGFKKKMHSRDEAALNADGSIKGTSDGDATAELLASLNSREKLPTDEVFAFSNDLTQEDESESISQSEDKSEDQNITRYLTDFIRHVYQQNSANAAQQSSSVLGSEILV